MKSIVVILFLIGCVASKSKNSFVQPVSSQSDFIQWNDKVILTWTDFQGLPDEQSEYKALTYTKIKSEPKNYTPDQIEYSITNFFNKNESWSKDKKSTDLLKHEKLHFDISELAARKTRYNYSIQDIAELEPSYEKLSKLFKEYAIEFKDSLNSAYDEETNHGINGAKQKEWEKKIALELKKMEKYSSTKVVIRRIKG